MSVRKPNLMRYSGTILLAISLFACTFGAWARYRISDNVIMYDHAFPRPAPYPDPLLLFLNNWFDARHPAPPGTIKLHGEIARIRATLDILILLTLTIMVAILTLRLWPLFQRRWRSRGFEVLPKP
jgi:hypothetical protein